MRLKFHGELNGLEEGIKILSGELGFEVKQDGIPIRVEKSSGNIEVTFDNENGSIKYKEKIHFFRALGILIEELRQNRSFAISEEPQFTLNGAMFDCSRNGVMKVESVKQMLLKMAVMGLNMLMLYTEDTFEIEGEPYFGYMRGRYTLRELKECDDYADNFGIEIIPCIQTLAHLEQFLKWSSERYLRDTIDILLAESDDTYRFIEKMIKSVSSAVRSKRIHIGMDEAHNLGLGRYLDINGYKERFNIMNTHLKKVIEITSKYDLKPMIWSDMYFRLGSKTRDYYDLEAVIPEEAVRQIPADLQLVYWDYYHNEEGFYSEFIKKHKEFGSTPVFAGAIWTWVGMCTNYQKTFISSRAALDACKKEGVKEVIVTIWNDNGNENNSFSALLGLQLYAECGYARELDMDKLKKRVKFCTGIDFDAFYSLTYLDQIPGADDNNLEPSNPSRYLFWQDILISLFDRHIEGLNLTEHYAELEYKIKAFNNKESDLILGVPQKLCAVLKIKCDIGLRIKKAYDENNLSTLKQIVNVEIPELSKRVNELRFTHREQWFKTYKPFGWEVIDIRYGGLLARIDTAIKRLADYVEGNIDRIEEVEEERIYFDGVKQRSEVGVGYFNQYHRIVTACAFF